MTSEVVVVGSYNQDHVWTSGELPAPGATRLGDYRSGPGGKGFNQAVAASRAGARTLFITALGDDAAAFGARALATAEGIDLRDEVHHDLPSGTAGIFVDAEGRNMIVVAPGANAALSTGFIDAQADDFTGVGVLLAQLEVAADAVLRALQRGRSAGALTILNPAPANAPTTPELLAAADILTPNETEFAALHLRHCSRELAAAELHERSDEDLHRLCRELGRATWVITLGAHGAFVSHGAGTLRGDVAACYRVAAAPAQAIDTTGAGDAFSGALAASLARSSSQPFRDAIAFACRYAARSTERRGAALAMPHLAGL